MNEELSAKRELNGFLALLVAVKALFLLFGSFAADAVALFVRLFNPGAVLSDVIDQLNDGASDAGMLLDLCATLFCVVVPICLYFFISGKTFRSVAPAGKVTLFQIVTAASTVFIVGQAAATIGDYFSYWLYSMFGLQNTYEEIVSEPVSAPYGFVAILLYGTIVAVVPALTEETLVRGIGLHSTRNFGIGFSIFASGFFFAFLHNSITQIPMAFAVGCMLAYFTLRYKSIWIAVVAHFFYNFNSVLYLVAMNGGDSTWAYFCYILRIFLIVIPAVGFTVAGLIVYGLRKPEQQQPVLRPLSKFGTLFKCPMFYVFLALSFVSIVREILIYLY